MNERRAATLELALPDHTGGAAYPASEGEAPTPGDAGLHSCQPYRAVPDFAQITGNKPSRAALLQIGGLTLARCVR